MKKRTVYRIALIVFCLAVFLGYRIWDSIRTDSTPPEIHFDTAQIPELSVKSSHQELLVGITATDKVDGDVTDSLIIESIQITDTENDIVTVCVAAFDNSHNVTKAQRQVRFTDYEGPKFDLEIPLVFFTTSTVDILNHISASDPIDGDITHRIRATSLSDSSLAVPGIHDVAFRVSNSLGHVVELVIPFEVLASDIYQANLVLADYLIYLDQGKHFNPYDYLDAFFLNREEYSLKNGLPNHFSLELTGSVDTNTPGVYAVSYKITYTRPSGTATQADVNYIGYSKLIVVVEE